MAFFWEKERLLALTEEEIIDRFEKAKLRSVTNPKVVLSPDLHPAFGPRGALGLYVFHGRALFRRVRVEPLVDP
jgi:hypothetical protein